MEHQIYRYHAIVSTDEPDDIHKRVSVDAETLVEAERLFEAEYGKDRVVKVWGDYESEKRRRYSI